MGKLLPILDYFEEHLMDLPPHKYAHASLVCLRCYYKMHGVSYLDDDSMDASVYLKPSMQINKDRPSDAAS